MASELLRYCVLTLCLVLNLCGQMDALPSAVDFALDDICVYNCPFGTKEKNPNHTATFNGCGPEYLTVTFEQCPYLTNCCDAHDLCYGTYDQSKYSCDMAFKACNNNPPSGLDAADKDQCLLCGDVMTDTVIVGACPFYLSSQSRASICVE